MIGDPKDSGERVLNSRETVKDWVERVRRQIEPFLSFEGENAATMVNNLDWTATSRRSTSCATSASTSRSTGCWPATWCGRRLEAGISYTEFSYVLLQSMDFLNLYREHGVTLQFGGSDQWGNLTGGVELIRRADGGHAHAFATPLVTKADGTKYGKTEGGALWLDPEMMSPYAFYQFWLNVEDERSASCCGSSPSSRGPRSRGSRPSTPRSRSCGPASARSPSRSPRWCTAPGDRADQGGLRGAVRRRRAGRPERRRPRSRAARGPAARRTAAPRLPHAWSTCWSTPDCRRARARPAATMGEGGAYLNNRRVNDPDVRPTSGDLLAGGWLRCSGAARRTSPASTSAIRRLGNCAREPSPAELHRQEPRPEDHEESGEEPC